MTSGSIFVGGVHGVGKTTACQRVARRLAVAHRTAGSMIKERDASALQLQTKQVKHVRRNQELLIHSVGKFFAAGGQRLILDGHFCLTNAACELETIAPEVFAALNLNGIVTFFDCPDEIYSRRLSRDMASPSVADLANLQRNEMQHAQLIARTLEIPCFEIRAFDLEAFVAAVVSIWQLNSRTSGT